MVAMVRPDGGPFQKVSVPTDQMDSTWHPLTIVGTLPWSDEDTATYAEGVCGWGRNLAGTTYVNHQSVGYVTFPPYTAHPIGSYQIRMQVQGFSGRAASLLVNVQSADQSEFYVQASTSWAAADAPLTPVERLLSFADLNTDGDPYTAIPGDEQSHGTRARFDAGIRLDFFIQSGQEPVDLSMRIIRAELLLTGSGGRLFINLGDAGTANWQPVCPGSPGDLAVNLGDREAASWASACASTTSPGPLHVNIGTYEIPNWVPVHDPARHV